MEILVIIGLLLLLGGPGQSIGGVTKTKVVTAYPGGKLNPYFGLIPRGKQIGVYIIYKEGKPVYIGYSGSQLYSTFTRHFQSWDDPRQVRVTYPKSEAIKARVIYCNTSKQAAALEKALILRYKPKDNPTKYESYTTTAYDEKQLNDYNHAEPPF